MRRLSSRPQRGATAVIVAILLVGLIGFTAIAVDVGAAWADRKQLQNGADAAALAIAQQCAEGSCPGDANAEADRYAEANKFNATAGVTGSAVIDAGAQRVTARAEENLNHWFAPVIGINSSLVAAEATAGWGNPSGGTTVPLTFSLCEFYWQTGTEVGSPPDTTQEFQIFLMTKTVPSEEYSVLGQCGTQAAHNEANGGFGWLDPDTGSCLTSSEGGYVPGNTGIALPCDVGAALKQGPVLIPIFDRTDGESGSNVDFHLYSYAQFDTTGFCFKNQDDGKWNVGNDNCNKKYIKGRFIKWVSLEDAEFGTLPNLGAQVVKLLG